MKKEKKPIIDSCTLLTKKKSSAQIYYTRQYHAHTRKRYIGEDNEMTKIL